MIPADVLAEFEELCRTLGTFKFTINVHNCEVQETEVTRKRRRRREQRERAA